MPKITWRDYLKGKYEIKNKNFEKKMRHDIRGRAIQMMRDLKLICKKASVRDKILIFKNPKTRKELVIPLIIELENTSKRRDERLENIMDLARELRRVGMKYDLTKLLRDTGYRKRKRVRLFLKWGFQRKYAEIIAEKGK